MNKADRQIVARIAKMLETAASEADYQVKWARVNRAAGILVGAAAGPDLDDDQEEAAGHAEDLANDVSQALVGVLEPSVLKTMIEGLAKRVAFGLVEFYQRG